MPAPTSDERAGSPELGQARLHGGRLAGALEHDVDVVVDDPGRLHDGRHLEVVGVEHPRGPDRGGEGLAPLAGLGAAHVVDAHGPQGGDRQRSDRARAHHQRRLAGLDAGPRDAVEGDGQGLGQRGRPGVDPGRPAQQLRGGRHLVGGEGSLLGPDAGRVARGAQRRPVGPAHRAPAAPGHRPTDDRVADLPVGHRTAHRRHTPDPLVAVPAAPLAPALEDHVEVAAAHPAQLDLDEHVAVAHRRHGHLLDLRRPGPRFTAAIIRWGTSCSSNTRVTILPTDDNAQGSGRAVGCSVRQVCSKGEGRGWGEGGVGRCAGSASPRPPPAASSSSPCPARAQDDGTVPRTPRPSPPSGAARHPARSRRSTWTARPLLPIAGVVPVHRPPGRERLRDRPPDGAGLGALPRAPGSSRGRTWPAAPSAAPSRPSSSRSSRPARSSTTRSPSTPTRSDHDQSTLGALQLGKATDPISADAIGATAHADTDSSTTKAALTNLRVLGLPAINPIPLLPIQQLQLDPSVAVIGNASATTDQRITGGKLVVHGRLHAVGREAGGRPHRHRGHPLDLDDHRRRQRQAHLRRLARGHRA